MDERKSFPRKKDGPPKKPFRKFDKPEGGRKGGGKFRKGGPGGGGGRFRRKMERRPGKAILQPEQLQRGPLARLQALQVLVDADESNQYVDQVLDEKIRAQTIGLQDRHLIKEIAFGAVRHRNTIDALLDHYVQFSMRRQHVAVRWALRLGAYQLIYLSRIPPHAAIHGTMEALKGINGIQARDIGFANAVLRRLHADILRKSEEPPSDAGDVSSFPAREGWCYFTRPVLPLPSLNKTLYLAIKHSHPKWLLARWIERFGEEEAIRLCEANNRVPMVTAILTRKAPAREQTVAALEEAGVTVEPGTLPEALHLKRTGEISSLEPFANGWLRIQDETAKRIGDALAPPPGARVLDLCAAPGGKAAQLLEQIGPDGHLVACDVGEEKLARLRENLERVGSNFTLLSVPPEPESLPLNETFSHILVDAPCSNTGVLARRPEARWRIHLEDFPALAALQVRILGAALKRLTPGGRLVYATCSTEPEENGQVVAAARRRYSGLAEASSRLFLPHRDGADGGYYAILEAPKTNWPPK